MLHCNCHYIRYIDYVSVNLPLSYAYHITAKVGITITMFIVYVGTTYLWKTTGFSVKLDIRNVTRPRFGKFGIKKEKMKMKKSAFSSK